MPDVQKPFRAVKSALRERFPERYLQRRRRRHQQKVRGRLGIPGLAQWFVECHGTVVRAGPFAGLEYSPVWIGEIDAPVAKLLGAYESELHGVLEHVLRDPPSTFVNIGAAEGYYAIGFALRSPRTTVYAFEADAWARRRLRELAALNRVSDRVVVRKACTAEAVSNLRASEAFVLADCEGAELDIFTGRVARTLASCAVLVELHDRELGIDVLSALEPVFAASHAVTSIDGRPREPNSYRELEPLPARERRTALDELRTGAMRWALFSPRLGAPSA